jgi:hypothetical protein
MNGMINDPGQILGNAGTTLHVTGPIKFESDERGAVVHVTVTQGGSEVTGDSDFTPSNAQHWSATICGTAKFVRDDTARCEATATVRKTDGSFEEYPEPRDPVWAREIDLW